jgi:hypothetical protein
MHRPLADRLIEMCIRHSDEIAESWYKNLVSNARTHTYQTIPRETCLRHAVSIYKNLGKMYLTENPYQAVRESLDISGLTEDQFARGIPLEEIVYAIILMRREVWFQSEQRSLFNAPEDLYELVVSINRVLLLFDYTSYIVVEKYRQMSEKMGKVK